MNKDLIVFRLGKYHDFEEIDSDCGYVVETIEPFLDARISNDKKISDARFEFSDKEGKKYNEPISRILPGPNNNGITVYYGESPKKADFDPTKLPGTRRPGMLNSLLEQIDMFVYEHKIGQ